MKIWSLGDAVVDLLPLEAMRYQACAGGAPANVAVGLAKLGCQSGFIGRVGNDPFGHFLIETLEAEGVNCQQIEQDSTYKTSTVVVNLAANGERSFTFLVSPSADQFLSEQALPEFGRDILHFCSLALVGEHCRETVKAAIEQVKQQQGLVSVDLNLRAQMWSDKGLMRTAITEYCGYADILKLSDEELFWLTETRDNEWQQAISLLAAYPAQIVIITRGAEGAIAIINQQQYVFQAYAVKSIDSTGAGDAFVAGLLANIARRGLPADEQQLASLITTASACGALATTNKGALAALPNQQQLIDFIQQHNHLTPLRA